jgi:hypothetical protein
MTTTAKRSTKRAGYSTCDGCNKERRDVRSCGHDTNGDPEAPDLCFLCRVEYERGREYDPRRGRYVSVNQLHDEAFNRYLDEMANELQHAPTPSPAEQAREAEMARDYAERVTAPIPEFVGACAECGLPKINHYYMAGEYDIPRFIGCDEAQLHAEINAARAKVAR